MGAQIDFFCKFTRKANKSLKVFLAGGSGQMNWGMVDPTSLRAPTRSGAELRRATAGREKRRGVDTLRKHGWPYFAPGPDEVGGGASKG